MNNKILITSILVVALLSVTSAQPVDKAKLDQLFDRLAEKNKGMGSFVFMKEGKPVYSRAFGYSQISGTEKKPMTSENRFRIGSITKTFTATLIMKLVEEGKLKLSDPLSKFLPQVPNADKITIEQILSHRSGIPNIKRQQNADRNVNTLPLTKNEHLALIVNTPPDFEPGTKAMYSNSGYFILGLVIEKVTGKSYEQVLEEKITKKIGLTDTYLATGNIDVNKKESLTYFIPPGGEWQQVPETHPSILFSAGAIVSTPTDLCKFISALFEGKIVSKASLDQMKSMKDGEGFGLVTFEFDGKTFYGHTGGADNYGAWVSYQPEEKLAVAYTTNAKVYPVKDIMAGAVDIYYNKPFQVPTFESLAVSTELLDKYVGEYSRPGAPAKFIITRKENTLYGQPPGGQNPFPLEATAENKFKVDNGTPTGIVVEFDLEKNQMTIKRNGEERVFTKEK
ncbi:serine hydrolase domain-containing protein [Pollutibacter soli]|uniref:serine hydrolase domain-containing protein n=1 Tax=Pollutibacter soli TaxID=3034157 RepID=UPI00301393F0